MSTEPQVSADLYSALKERLRTGDKQDEIELYYELLSSGHSVGEILNAVGPIRSKSEDVNTAVAEHPQSEAGGVATDAMPAAALVDEAQVHALRAPGLSAPPETGTYRTEELQAGESPLLNEFRSDDWIQRLSANLPRSARGTVRAASAHIFTSRAVAISSSDVERVRHGKFSSTAKRIAFLVVYMVAFSSAPIGGFLIMRGGRDAEPTTTHAQSDVSIETESITIRNPVEDHSETVSKPLIQEQQVGSADFSHAPNPSLPAEPNSALSSPAQKVEVEGQNANFAGRPEAEASQESEPGQPDGVAQLIEQLNHQAAETPDPAHEPIPLVEQSPAAAAAGSAEAAPHSDAAQSDAGNPLDATPKDAAQATATVPTENVSAALHSRAHTAKTRNASAPRRYTEPQQSVPQQTPARYTQPASDGQLPRSYPNSDRGYGYGGPEPNSDMGG